MLAIIKTMRQTKRQNKQKKVNSRNSMFNFEEI